MAVNWKDDETLALINIWGDDVVQAQLEGCKRNKSVYEKISKAMKDGGYERTAEQCREKAKKLKMDYRKIKDKHRVTGTGRKTWKFLEPLDQVLGDKPTTEPPVVVDTSHTESVEIEKGGSTSVTEENLSDDAPTSLTDGELSGTSTDNQSISSDNMQLKSRTKKATKRKNREDWIEKLIDTVADKMIAASAESDQKFIELEEKRLKFEMEEKEREERMRKEEREFQLRVFSMMCSQTNSNYHLTSPSPWNQFEQ